MSPTIRQTKLNILVTGATGFVGRELCRRLTDDDFFVRGTLLETENPASLSCNVEPSVIAPLGKGTAWETALSGIDVVIHLAARVHIMNDPSLDPLAEFRRVNTEGTEHLAREAAKAGVKRFVFISSIKVNGEESPLPYTESSPVQPTDPYGVSKWEAERLLRNIESETGLEVVVVRPTLVYGPRVKANFLNLMKIVSKGIPLPLASITNKRSLIYVGNLADALACCATHPAAAGQAYLMSDDEDVSTPELIRRIATALEIPARLFPFPTGLMRSAGKMLGKSSAVERLVGSLQVDSSKIRRELGWSPPFTMEKGLAETAAWFLYKA